MYRRCFIKWIPPSLVVAMLTAATGESRTIQTNRNGVPTAAPDAAVDTVAYSYQKRAIVQLQALLAQRKGAAGEDNLLARLAQLQMQNSETAFRIAHAEAYYEKKPIDTQGPQTLTRQALVTLDRLVYEFPNYSDRASVLILRARAYEDLGQKPKALVEYEKIAKQYPNHPQMESIYFTLSEMKSDQGDHAAALVYLGRLEKNSQVDRAYVFQRTAYTYYALRDFDKTFLYMRKFLIHQVSAHKSNMDAVAPLLESNYMELVQFYFDASVKDPSHYSIGGALAFFRELLQILSPADAPPIQAHPLLGKLAFRFAKILRTQGKSEELRQFKDSFVRDYGDQKEAVEIWVTVYEDELNKFQYPTLVSMLGDLDRIRVKQGAAYSDELPKKLVLLTAERLQKILQTTKTPAKQDEVAEALTTFYQSYLKMVDPAKDPRVLQIQLNLAESFMLRKRPLQALPYFQWVMDRTEARARVPASQRQTQEIAYSDIAMKVLAIRYEDLFRRKIIPQELKSVSLRTPVEEKPFPPEVVQWMGWVHKQESLISMPGAVLSQANASAMEQYQFEIQRLHYAFGHHREALDGIAQFLKIHPKSTYSLAGGSLVLDTYIASESWDQATQWALAMMKVPAFEDKAQQERLMKIAANSYYKQAEAKSKAGEHSAVLGMGKVFYERFAQSERRLDWFNLLARSALELKNEKQAKIFLDAIVREGGNSKYALSALAVKASISEKQQDLGAAIREYSRYLHMQAKAPPSTLDPYRRKVLFLSWVAGTERDLQTALTDPAVCVGVLVKDCERIRSLTRFQNRSIASIAPANTVLRKQDPTLFVMDLLTQIKSNTSASVTQELEWVQQLAKVWNSVDPIFQFTLIPDVNQSLPRLFKTIRGQLQRMVRIRADQAVIAKRVQWIQTVEKSAALAVTLPLLKVRALILFEVGSLYLDLAREIYWIPAPKGLQEEEKKVYQSTLLQIATPFKDLGAQLQKQAWDMGVQGRIDEDAFVEMSPKASAPIKTEALGLEQMGRVDPDWTQIQSLQRSDDPALQVRIYWAQAVRQRRLHQMAYHLQEAHERKIDESIQVMMRAISFATAGAKAEAWQELKQAGL